MKKTLLMILFGISLSKMDLFMQMADVKLKDISRD